MKVTVSRVKEAASDKYTSAQVIPVTMGISRLETIVSIFWLPEVAQFVKGQGHSFKPKMSPSQKHASAHLCNMGKVHSELGRVNLKYNKQSRCHKNLKDKDKASRSKVKWASKYASTHLPLMGNVHTNFGDRSSDTMNTAGGTGFSRSRAQLQGQRSQGAKNANAHICFMNNVHTQFGDCSYNSLGTASGTRVSRSRSHVQSQRGEGA